MARQAALRKLRTFAVKLALDAADYEELGLRVEVLDFKPLRVRISGAINVETDDAALRERELAVCENELVRLTTSSKTVGLRSMRPAPEAAQLSSGSAAATA